MPGMPETPGGRSWQMATGEAMLATATTGANDGVIPNQQSGRLTPDRVTKERRQKGYTSKEKEEHYAHIGTWNVRTMRALGKLHLLIEELDNIGMYLT